MTHRRDTGRRDPGGMFKMDHIDRSHPDRLLRAKRFIRPITLSGFIPHRRRGDFPFLPPHFDVSQTIPPIFIRGEEVCMKRGDPVIKPVLDQQLHPFGFLPKRFTPTINYRTIVWVIVLHPFGCHAIRCKWTTFFVNRFDLTANKFADPGHPRFEIRSKDRPTEQRRHGQHQPSPHSIIVHWHCIIGIHRGADGLTADMKCEFITSGEPPAITIRDCCVEEVKFSFFGMLDFSSIDCFFDGYR